MNIELRSKNLPLTTRAAEGLERRRWCIAEIEAAIRTGVISPNERLELIGGEIVPLRPESALHDEVCDRLSRFFKDVAPGYLRVARDASLTLDESTFVEPDFCVFRGDITNNSLDGASIALAIEVADESLAYDRGRKIGVYAAAGVREVWVIDVNRESTWLHRRLGAEGYREVAEVPAARLMAPLLAPEVALRLADLEIAAAGKAA